MNPTIENIAKFCICLPERHQRIEVARNHFNDMGLGGVTFVPGINGEKMGLRTVHPYTCDDKSGNFKCGPHETGIYLSNIMLWFHISLTHDWALVMEDDCLLRPNWRSELDAALRDMPADTDFLFCGHCCAAGAMKDRIKGNVWSVRYPACFHMQIISRRGAKILLETQRKMWGPVDIVTHVADPLGGSQTSFDKMKVYSIMPRIADQRGTVIPD